MKESKLTSILRCIIIVLFVGAVTTAVWAQKATLTGKVTDAESGETLPGANVLVSSSAIQTGAAAKTDGQYEVKNLVPGTYTVTVSYIGYEKKIFTDIVLTAEETKSLDISLLQVGLEFNPIAITASRRPEKVLEAPASISVLEARDIALDVSTSSSSILRNVTGVDLAQTGIDRREIVMRGFNNAFSGEAYVLTDNRQAQVPSLGVNIHSIMPNMNIDLDRIEIVRGPGAALYGAGVDEGVIHYITKDPFDYPGTTFSFSRGERSYLATSFRHAGVINKNFGYKITAQYAVADDWKLNSKDSLDADQLAIDVKKRDYSFRKSNINGLLQYRFSDKVKLTANGGLSSIDATVLTGVGTAQADGWGYAYGQLRLQAGNFFAQAYLNRNNAGDTFIYGTGLPLVDKSTLLNVQAQYDLELADGKQQFIFGFDYERTTPVTDSTIYGRNEENDMISETGGYVQSQTAISSKLDLTAALRLDYNNLQEEIVPSPRVAIVFKPTAEHSFRATFNRAFTSPGATEWFLDIVSGQIPGTNIIMRGRGSTKGFTFSRNSDFAAFAGTDLVAYSLNPAMLGAPQPVGLPLDATYASVYAGISSIPISVLKTMLPAPLNLLPDPQIAGLVALLAPSQTQVTGFSKGSLGLLNRFSGTVNPVSTATDIDPLKRNTTNSFELGYKGVIQNRMLFAVDFYYTNKKNFVGPLLFETPFVLVPNLSKDLTAALTTGIGNNATLAATLQAAGLSAEQVAQLIVGLAASSDPNSPLANPATPVAIVAPKENAPKVGETPELMLAYRNFGNVNFWGVDASLHILATDDLTFFGNLSYVSDDFFNNEDLNETNTDLAVALNAPKFKTKFGFNYTKPFGISLNASARYIKGFPVWSGTYLGGRPAPFNDTVPGVENYFLLDVGVGYDLGRYAPNMRFDIAVQNVLNNKHREFIGAPKLGRLALARLSFTVR